MSLKNIIFLLIFSLLSVYMAFLNPHEVKVNFSQSFSLELPMVVLLLGFILMGVVLTVFLEWGNKIKSSFGNMRATMKKREIERKDKWCEAQFEKGENAYTGGNLAKAKDTFQNILEEFPNHVGALNFLGKIFLREGNIERAMELHQKGAQVAPTNVKILSSLADDYAAAGMPAKEVQVLDKIRSIDPNSPLILFRIRDSHVEKKEWEQAASVQKRALGLIKDAEELKQEEQRLSQLIYANAVAKLDQGNLEGAIVEFKKALKTDDTCLPTYITLGDIHLKSGNPKAALKTWLAGFEKTRSPVCLLRVQKVFQAPEERQNLIKVYREAIEQSLDGERDMLVMLLANLQLENNEADAAIETLNNHELENTLYRTVMLAQAYQQKQDSAQMKQTSQEAYSRVRDMLIEKTYNDCLKNLKDWDSYFPEYKSWDNFKRGDSQPVLTQGNVENVETAAPATAG